MRTCLLTDTPTLASHTHINTNPQVAGIDFAAELIRIAQRRVRGSFCAADAGILTVCASSMTGVGGVYTCEWVCVHKGKGRSVASVCTYAWSRCGGMSMCRQPGLHQ